MRWNKTWGKDREKLCVVTSACSNVISRANRSENKCVGVTLQVMPLSPSLHSSLTPHTRCLWQGSVLTTVSAYSRYFQQSLVWIIISLQVCFPDSSGNSTQILHWGSCGSFRACFLDSSDNSAMIQRWCVEKSAENVTLPSLWSSWSSRGNECFRESYANDIYVETEKKDKEKNRWIDK